MNKRILRIIIGSVFYLTGLITFVFVRVESFWAEASILSAAYIIIGGDIVFKAFKNILKGKVFDENFLMTVATIGALAIFDFAEAVTVMLFYQIGEIFQSYAVGKSRRSIASLMDIRPDYAFVKEDGQLVKRSPEDVKTGDVIVVSAGEKIPLDGEVLDGFSLVDTSALTGESLPREVSVGSEVISGCININGVITVKVTSEFKESTVSKILNLVENATSKKSSQENFITRFARFYTPIVVSIAIILAILPPLLIDGATFSDWIYRALTFLVVSCPCALVVSIPMSFFGGIGGASKSGVLVKGSNYLEVLARTDTIVFDKTGTLTKGVFKVLNVVPFSIERAELLRLTALVESYSTHPIATALIEAYKEEIKEPFDKTTVSNIEEIAGHGVSAVVDNKRIFAGNAKLMKKMNIEFSPIDAIGTVVYVAIDGSFKGYIVISDEIKKDSYAALNALKATGIKTTVMLTGDLDRVGQSVGRELKIDKIFTELLPQGKVEKIEQLFNERSGDGKIAFVGDGINDAPVLARADIGIAMGGLGSDAAIEAADVVIMNDSLSKIAVAKRIAKKTIRIATQNIVFALSIKIAVLALSAVGLANMWMAIFADVGVSVLAVLNAMRCLKGDI